MVVPGRPKRRIEVAERRPQGDVRRVEIGSIEKMSKSSATRSILTKYRHLWGRCGTLVHAWICPRGRDVIWSEDGVQRCALSSSSGSGLVGELKNMFAGVETTEAPMSLR